MRSGSTRWRWPSRGSSSRPRAEPDASMRPRASPPISAKACLESTPGGRLDRDQVAADNLEIQDRISEVLIRTLLKGTFLERQPQLAGIEARPTIVERLRAPAGVSSVLLDEGAVWALYVEADAVPVASRVCRGTDEHGVVVERIHDDTRRIGPERDHGEPSAAGVAREDRHVRGDGGVPVIESDHALRARRAEFDLERERGTVLDAQFQEFSVELIAPHIDRLAPGQEPILERGPVHCHLRNAQTTQYRGR